MSEEIQLQKGDKVRLCGTHHSHNDELEKLIGEEGEVRKVQDSQGKVLVYFDEDKTAKLIERWWMNPKWLEKTDEEV